MIIPRIFSNSAKLFSRGSHTLDYMSASIGSHSFLVDTSWNHCCSRIDQLCPGASPHHHSGTAFHFSGPQSLLLALMFVLALLCTHVLSCFTLLFQWSTSSSSFLREDTWKVYLLARAVLTNYHKLSGLKQQIYSLTVSKTRILKMRCQ